MSNIKISHRQFKAARALVGWSQADLAVASGVSELTIKGIEEGNRELVGHLDAGNKLKTALQGAGIVFLFENEVSHRGGAGVRLKLLETDEGLRLDQLTSDNDG